MFDESVAVIKSGNFGRETEFLLEKKKAPGAPQIELPDWRKICIIVSLMFMNICLFMDRGISGAVLPQITNYYGFDNTQAGLLKTFYVCGITGGAVMWGMLAKFVNRKWIIVLGVFFWSLWVIVGPMASTRNSGWVLIFSRLGAGIGASAPASIVPTVLADLYSVRRRPLIINMYIFSAVTGTAMAFILGGNLQRAMDGVGDRPGWKWSIALTAVYTWPFVILCAIFLPNLKLKKRPKQAGGKSSPFEDIIYIVRNKTFILIVCGNTLLDFSNSAFSYWSSTLLGSAVSQDPSLKLNLNYETLIGLDMGLGGALGCLFTAELCRQVKNRYLQEAQPLIAGMISMWCGVVCLLGQELITYNIRAAWVVFCFAAFCITANNAVSSDVIMGTNPPFARPMASALQILISHLIGNGLAPIFIGALSEGFMSGKENTYTVQFDALKNACMMSYLFGTIGGVCILFASLTYIPDIRKAEAYNDVKQFRNSLTYQAITRSTIGNRVAAKFKNRDDDDDEPAPTAVYRKDQAGEDITFT